jgi:hypothetical protein
VQPDIVVLELCKDRTNILHLDEETVLEEAKNLTMDKMILAIRQNGTIQVLTLFRARGLGVAYRKLRIRKDVNLTATFFFFRV